MEINNIVQETITFIDSIDSLNSLNLKKLNPSKIFSFNIEGHQFLEKEKISHVIAENYLEKDDKNKIFANAINLWNWYDNDLLNKEFTFEGINLLSITDTSEFHQIIIREIFNFYVIKRILEKEKPKKIILSKYFSKIVRQLNDQIILEIFDKQEHDFHIQWEKMLIRFTILNRPISIPISRKNYNKFKKIFEYIVGNLFGLLQNSKNNKPSILFLEFNPAQYPKLLENLKNFNGNIIFFNRRRPAAWNIPSIKLLKKFKIKQISPELFLSKSDNEKIKNSVDYFTKKLEKFFLSESIIPEIFKIDGINFWPIISEMLYDTYKRRISEYLQLILVSQKIFSQLNIKSIISLNILGETEKTILAVNNFKTPSILLEHGATNYTSSISHYDISNMYPIFKDKIALWGNIQKEYLLNHRNISSDRIFVTGSPRHEDFFKKSQIEKQNSEKVILITPQAMTEFNALSDTNSYLKLEKILIKIFEISKNFSNVKLVVKMHPTLGPGNEFVKNLIYKLNPNVKILQLESVLEVISSCDLMFNINTELFPSTVLYEGLILKKPIINFTMMDEQYDFEFIKDNAVLSISSTDDIEDSLKKILYDKNFSSQLIKNGELHLQRYFSNQFNASENLANILVDFCEK